MLLLLALSGGAAAAPTPSGAGYCDLNGTWNIDVNVASKPIPLTLTQAAGSRKFSMAWGGQSASGEMIAADKMRFNSLVGTATASPFKDPATGKAAPPCTLLTFGAGGGTVEAVTRKRSTGRESKK